ncbi:MAG TPA: carbamoyltransferase [Thermoanaerobaculia bacterium]|nr:carbamoyltransferase [Thermoanaerobaculia bacterium]
MTAILGISAFYHDSAAALVVDGAIVAAAQEERFTRKKHDEDLPVHAIEHCLRTAGLAAADLDYVAFYDKPLLKFERLLETYLAYAPRGFDSFRRAMAVWLPRKLHTRRELHRGLAKAYRRRLVFTEHHEAHAASAFYPSPFEEAAILTLDGVGEWATASIGVGRGSRLELHQELHFPHSLGLLYSAFTYFCGFKVNSGEYKLMGLAPYGEPRFADVIRERLLDLKDDGSFRMDLSYFDYCAGLRMTGRRFERLFGGPARRPEAPITQREMDLAASIQLVTEEIVLRMVRHVHRATGQSRLCMAGGVALNCVANGRVHREGPFSELWVQPAAGDAGGALGAALFVWHQLLGRDRVSRAGDSQRGSLLGPRFSNGEIERFLAERSIPHRRFADEPELLDRTSDLLRAGKVVGWFHGPMEFGPRALGARSILGDPRDPEMQATMNLKIKFRESFRPFAPSVLRSRVHEYFETREEEDEPYMLVVAPVHPSKRRAVVEENGHVGLERRKVARSVIPAVTHVDGSARVQTVDAGRNPRYTRLLEAFERKTGCPVLINTSFNVRGEPIVCTPEDAYRCFLATGMDALVLEDFLLVKEEQPASARAAVAGYERGFELD